MQLEACYLKRSRLDGAHHVSLRGHKQFPRLNRSRSCRAGRSLLACGLALSRCRLAFGPRHSANVQRIATASRPCLNFPGRPSRTARINPPTRPHPGSHRPLHLVRPQQGPSFVRLTSKRWQYTTTAAHSDSRPRTAHQQAAPTSNSRRLSNSSSSRSSRRSRRSQFPRASPRDHIESSIPCAPQITA